MPELQLFTFLAASLALALLITFSLASDGQAKLYRN